MLILNYLITSMIFTVAFLPYIYLFLNAKTKKEQIIAVSIFVISITGLICLLYTDIGSAICTAVMATTPA
jgi:multisubunit Na+/H+ antiporter MnhF subunit